MEYRRSSLITSIPDREKYDFMLQEVIDQLSLTIDRKYEDIDQLEKIRAKALTSINTSDKITELSQKMNTCCGKAEAGKKQLLQYFDILESLAHQNRTELSHSIESINKMVANINESITIESQFIQGTKRLLKDVVSMALETYGINRELMDKNEELDAFAYIASHDLQEPLRKINSFGDLLSIEIEAMKEQNSDVKKYLGFMMESSRRMQQLIRDLLAFSRSGRGEMVCSWCNGQWHWC
ncbi:MAG: hypothetical protein HQK62_13840 [Desulfamplus sp.]|nr:hypothetical protein [Desulfamplus sp.]